MWDSKWDLKSHFRNQWNVLDATSIAFLFIWAVLLPFAAHADIGRASLGGAAIVQAFALLQYVSLLSKDVGELVIISTKMLWDLLNFIVIMLVAMFGFGIAFRGLFYRSAAFSSAGQAFLTLFSAILGNYDFGDLESVGPFTFVGYGAMVFFVVISSVMLLNLLIARMSSTYDTTFALALEEWQSFQASVTQGLLLVRGERNALCMLPPPLNAVPTLVACVEQLLLRANGSLETSNAEAVAEAKEGSGGADQSVGPKESAGRGGLELISMTGTASNVALQ
jgi:hypothetical protein